MVKKAKENGREKIPENLHISTPLLSFSPNCCCTYTTHFQDDDGMKEFDFSPSFLRINIPSQ